MARKKGGEPVGAAESLSAQHLEVSREVGRLQKRARSLPQGSDERRDVEREAARLLRVAEDLDERTSKAVRQSQRRARVLPDNTLFQGGRKESSELEDSDDPFTAADLLRSRRIVENEQTYIAERYKRGPKKGKIKFQAYKGGLRERNEALLKPHKGKNVTVVVRFRKLSDGGMKTTTHTRRRTVRFNAYDELIDAYTDTMRSAIDEESEVAYYVQSVEFEPEEPPTPRRPKKEAPRTRPKRGAKRTKVKPKGKSRKKKKHAATGSSSVRKRSARKRGRRVGAKRKSVKRSSRA